MSDEKLGDQIVELFRLKTQKYRSVGLSIDQVAATVSNVRAAPAGTTEPSYVFSSRAICSHISFMRHRRRQANGTPERLSLNGFTKAPTMTTSKSTDFPRSQ